MKPEIRLSLLQFNHHSRRNAHRHKFLEQEFASVRHSHFRDLRLIATAFAFEGVVAKIGDRHEAAEIANVDGVGV